MTKSKKLDIAKQYLKLYKQQNRINTRLKDLANELKTSLNDQESIETPDGMVKLIAYAQSRFNANKAKKLLGEDKVKELYETVNCTKLQVSL